MAEAGGCGELLASSKLSIPPCGTVMAYAASRFSFGLIVVVLVAFPSFAQTARDYYKELYAAGGSPRSRTHL
jgi:hypothetical protein